MCIFIGPPSGDVAQTISGARYRAWGGVTTTGKFNFFNINWLVDFYKVHDTVIFFHLNMSCKFVYEMVVSAGRRSYLSKHRYCFDSLGGNAMPGYRFREKFLPLQLRSFG